MSALWWNGGCGKSELYARSARGTLTLQVRVTYFSRVYGTHGWLPITGTQRSLEPVVVVSVSEAGENGVSEPIQVEIWSKTDEMSEFLGQKGQLVLFGGTCVLCN